MQGSVPGPELVSVDGEHLASRVLVGGVVAHNDERRIQDSLRSLLAQELPPGVRWGRVWVVASGCTDRTVEVARAVARDDPRVGVIVEAERRGKAAALRQVLHRAQGEFLILLNSDAVAAPGAVSALLAKAAGKVRPFAVMARPLVPPPADAGWGSSMRWMWELHHELHLDMLEDGRGAHLSDELLLVSLPAFPWIEEGIINDGSYCAVWLRSHRGGCWYAPDSGVWIEVPRNPSEFLQQRRRIHVGNAQVRARLGRSPTTAFRYFLKNPSGALEAVRRSNRSGTALRTLGRVAAWEAVAHALALWDRIPPRRNHVRWSRIGSGLARPASGEPAIGTEPAGDDAVDRRVRVLLDVAGEFGTGLPLATLDDLLPERTSEPLATFLARRPELAKVVRDTAYHPTANPPPDPARTARGLEYARSAQALVRGPLRWLLPELRCIGITGSAAYGEPLEGDDLDFFVVTRAGALSWVLAATFLSLRLRALRGLGRGPPPCFNYVIDERRARLEYGKARGLLFAREALSTKIVDGDAYYRGLLGDATWMRSEFPHLYSVRSAEPGDIHPRPAPLLVRLLSAALFVPLAAYLQLAGLRHNARLRRSGRASGAFRTSTAPDRIALLSQRFEKLRGRYQDRPDPPPVSYAGVSAPSRIASSR